MSGAFGPVEWVLFLAVGVTWGSSYLLVAIGLESLPPPVITFVRILMGATVLAFVPSARRATVERADWAQIALLGLLWMALPLTLFPFAQQTVDSSVAGMLTGAQPLMAAAVAAYLLRRRPGRRQALGLSVGFTGIAAISLSSAESGGGSTVAGIAMVGLAVACYAVAVNIAVPLQQRYGGLAVVLRALLVALVLVTPLALCSLPALSGTPVSVSSAVALSLLGVLCTGFAYVMFAVLAGRAGATRGASAVYLIPVVAVLLGATIGGDPVRPVAVAGTALVLVGAYLTSRSEA